MEAFIFYSLESAICLAVLLLPYLIWFKKTTFYQWNRFYLLGAVFFSLLAPLVNIQIETVITPKVPQLTKTLSFFQEVPELSSQPFIEEQLSMDAKVTSRTPYEIDTSEVVEQTTSWDWEQYALAIYFLVFMVLGGTLLYRLSRLWWLIHQGKKIKYPTFTMVDLPDNRVFSFFSFILFNQQHYSEQELATLLKHEQAHIQQWHSLDVLVLEVLQVVFWFNPFYRIYLKYLQQEHEYFVDAAISRELGQPQYAQLLLSMAVAKPPLVGHAFAYIPVKHRIFKLFQKPSTIMEKSRFFIAIPIILSLLLTFSCSFDELGSLEEDHVKIARKVRSIKAHFLDEQSLMKQEINVGSIELNEDGTIADLEMKPHPVFGENIPHTYTKRNYFYKPTKEFFNSLPKDSSMPKDFFARQAKWFLMSDIAIGTKTIFYMAQYNNGRLILDFERHLAEKYESVEITENSFSFDQFRFTIKGNRSIYKENALIEKSVDLTKDGRLKVLTEHDIVEFPLYKHANPKSYSLKRSESSIKKEMHYSIEGLLERMQTKYTTELEFSNGKKSDSPYSFMGSSFRFFYDDKSNISEIEIYNKQGMFLRKYRFHYDEASFCTKKELINREGNVEFSVRFAYEFYN